MSREERLASNEVLFREVNERVHQGLGQAPNTLTRNYLCECGAGFCVENVTLLDEQYEAVRDDPLQFFLVPGHEALEVESVVARFETYYIVRKSLAVAEIAQDDPESH